MNVCGRAAPATARTVVRWNASGLLDVFLSGFSWLIKVTLSTAVVLGLAQPVAAQPSNAPFAVPYSGTLKKINDSGIVRIGYRENSPPFAFLDADKKPIGYSLDLCEIVVEEIAAELGKDIQVKYRPVTPENRFDLVNSGEVDLECGSTTNNVERRKTFAFSPTMFVTGT